MEFGILGPLEVRREGKALALGGTKQRALLSILLLEANKVVSGDRLAELLWGDEAPATARHAIEVYVSQVRRTLEPNGAPYQMLLTSPGGYTLRIGPSSLDAVQFQSMVEAAAQLAPEPRLDQLKAALGLWRGPVLAEFAAESFAVGEAARLNDLHLHAIEERIETELSLGRDAALIGELVALTNEYPLRERLCGLLMLGLYRSGRQAEASAVYQRTRERLVDELGMEPGRELQTLLKRILQHDDALNLDGSDTARTNLPAQMTSFIGRERESREIVDAVGQGRLVTLVGVGGCGKTRLAVHVVHGLAGQFADGARFVDLAPLTEASMVPQAIAASCGVREQPGRPLLQSVTDNLRQKSMLLLLDNCEHLVEGVAAAAETLLSSCRGLRVLTTSRERLRVDGEQVYLVPPLAVPPIGTHFSVSELSRFEGADLFVQRARQSRPIFALNNENAQDVAELCRRLDGIPLAIELAAAQVSALTPHEIIKNIGDRFGILASGDRTRLPKQQTLWATLEWSHQLLTEQEKKVFRRLSVFVGGFDLDAATRVAGEEVMTQSVIPAVVARLTDKSLLIAEHESSGLTRYRLLETVRKFAAESLNSSGEADIVRDKHAAHYFEWARHRQSRNRDVVRWLPEYAWDDDNLRAALVRLRSRRPHDGLQLATWMSRYWEVSGRLKEGTSWFKTIISAGNITDKQLLASAHLRAGILAYLDGDYPEASTQIAMSIDLKRELGDQVGVARRLGVFAHVMLAQGNSVRALELAEECHRLLLDLADEGSQAWASVYLAWIVYFNGDSARAKRLLTEAESPLRAASDNQGLGFVARGLLLIDVEAGDFPSARQRAQAVIDLVSSHKVYMEEPGWLGVLFALAEAEGRHQAASRLWGALLRLEGEGRSMYNLLRRRLSFAADRLRSTIGHAEFDKLLVEGSAMSDEALMVEALKEPERSTA